jgi:hypothetical protein
MCFGRAYEGEELFNVSRFQGLKVSKFQWSLSAPGLAG